jgi:hypothetical protein
MGHPGFMLASKAAPPACSPTTAPAIAPTAFAPLVKNSASATASPALTLPRTNGKAERFIQTALREWAYVRHYANSEERDLQLSPWLHYYNFTRPHGTLGYAPPISRSPASAGTTS